MHRLVLVLTKYYLIEKYNLFDVLLFYGVALMSVPPYVKCIVVSPEQIKLCTKSLDRAVFLLIFYIRVYVLGYLCGVRCRRFMLDNKLESLLHAEKATREWFLEKQ